MRMFPPLDPLSGLSFSCVPLLRCYPGDFSAREKSIPGALSQQSESGREIAERIFARCFQIPIARPQAVIGLLPHELGPGQMIAQPVLDPGLRDPHATDHILALGLVADLVALAASEVATAQKQLGASAMAARALKPDP